MYINQTQKYQFMFKSQSIKQRKNFENWHI